MQPPLPLESFTSSSGLTAIAYFRLDLPGGAPHYTFQGILKVPPGHPVADVFLTGVAFETTVSADSLRGFGAAARAYFYDAAAGEIHVMISGGLGTTGNQPVVGEVSFAVLLTDPAVGRLSRVSTGGIGDGATVITRGIGGAVPLGMQYHGLATQHLWVAPRRSGIRVAGMGALAGPTTLIGTDAIINMEAVARDATGQTPMFVEWSGSTIAFAATEVARHAGTLFPQYPLLGGGPSPNVWTGMAQNPTGAPIAGIIDLMEGVGFGYNLPPPAPPTDSDAWLVRATASHFRVMPGLPTVATSDYSMFFGTQFGALTNPPPTPFIQMDRVVGFLL